MRIYSKSVVKLNNTAYCCKALVHKILKYNFQIGERDKQLLIFLIRRGESYRTYKNNNYLHTLNIPALLYQYLRLV